MSDYEKHAPINEIESLRQAQDEINKLQAENAKLKNLIDTLPGDIYWKDAQGIYSGLNRRGELSLKKMGFIRDKADILGKTDFDIFNLETANIYRQNDLEVMENGSEITKEETAILPNGKKLIQLSTKKPLKDNENNIIGIVGSTIDITYLKTIEKELKKAKDLAESANHAKTEFIANMSHDIRTPLSGVVGLSELLANQIQQPEQRQYAHWIHDCGQRLLSLLNGILEVISADHLDEQELRPEAFNLSQFLQDLIQLERPTIELKHLKLDIKIDETIPVYLLSDRTKLHRVLLNLLGNAIKFTENGTITLEVNCLETNNTSQILRFSVCDTGIGIPKDMQPHVFDRFFRADPAYKGRYEGHGIGLNIAQSYAKQLGTEIKLNSEEGKGTEFYFLLKVEIAHIQSTASGISSVDKDSQSMHNVINDSCNSPLKSIPAHILIVEDNPIALKVAESMAMNLGCVVSSATQAKQALALVEQNEFDLVITDIGLPDGSGFELTRQIRNNASKQLLPIIGLTAHARASINEEGFKAGMNEVLTKPITLDMIHLILKRWVKQNSQKISHLRTHQGRNNGLGPDLPETEDALFNLNQYPLLDISSAQRSIGERTLLSAVLTLMANEAIPADLKEIQAAYQQQNWELIKKIAHKMKGGAVYCGTVRMKYACQYMERYLLSGHSKLAEPLYAQLLNVCQETLSQLDIWLEDHMPVV